MAEGTARSTDRDALLAVAAEMRPHAYELSVGKSWQSGWEMLVVGGIMAVAFGLVVGKKYQDPFTWFLLLIIGAVILSAPYVVANVLNYATYVSLLDLPVGISPPAGAAETGPVDVERLRSMECLPVSGGAMPDGAVLCVP